MRTAYAHVCRLRSGISRAAYVKASAFLGCDDVHASELLFDFLALARRAMVFALFEVVHRQGRRELLTAIQTHEFINRHVALHVVGLLRGRVTFGATRPEKCLRGLVGRIALYLNAAAIFAEQRRFQYVHISLCLRADRFVTRPRSYF